MQMKKTVMSLVMAAAVFSSATLSSGLGFLSEPAVSAAETAEIEDGSYIVPLQSMNWNFNRVLSGATLAFSQSPRCLLEVEDGKYQVTMKLNSEYLAGWVLDNSKNSQFPKVKNIWAALGADEKEEFDRLAAENGKYNTRYTFDESNNDNFSDVVISKDAEDDTWCYATFTLSDYTQKFYMIFWSKYQGGSGTNDNVESLQLDVSAMHPVSELEQKIAGGTTGVSIDNATYQSSASTSSADDPEFQSMLSTVANVTSAEGIVTADIDLATSQLGSSPLVAVNAFTKREFLDTSYGNNSMNFNASFDTPLLNEDGTAIEVAFTEKELIFGKQFTAETEVTKANRENAAEGESYMGYFGILYLTTEDVVDVNITDSEGTGAYVTGRSDVLPEDAKLTVVEDRGLDEYPESMNYTRDAIVEVSGTMYNSPKHWFYISLTDSAGNDLSTYDGITLHIPMVQEGDSDPNQYIIWGFHSNDGLFFNTENAGNDAYGSVVKMENGTYEFQYVGKLGQINIQHATFFYAQPGDYADVHGLVKSGADDGIYQANAQLQKFGTNGSSMANAALNPAVMITVHDGVAKMYFTSHYLTVNQQQAYIGELMSYDVSKSKTWFEDSVYYTKFLTDEEGNLVENCGYDPITEAGCVEGGVLTLREESYDADKNCYDLAVVPPAMLGGADYSTIDKSELTVHLRITDLQRVGDYSEANLNTLVKANYPYDVSAVTRQVEIAKLKLADSDSYSAKSVAQLQKIWDDNQLSSYSPSAYASKSSAELETLGLSLEDAIRNLTSVSAGGYHVELKNDVVLNFYLSLNTSNTEQAQDGDLTAAVTGPDGTVSNVPVTYDSAAKMGKVQINIAPKEIASDVTVALGEYQFTYSVQDYLEKMLYYAENSTEAAADGVTVSADQVETAKALLNYGAYAQKYFTKKNPSANAYLNPELANVNYNSALPETVSDAVIGEVPEFGDTIAYCGAALVCDYTTSIRLYFNVSDEIADHSFAVTRNGVTEKVTPTALADGGYYIEIGDIYANYLTNSFEITVDGTSMQYGVYNYIAGALNASKVQSGAVDELHDLVKALYQYAEAVKNL